MKISDEQSQFNVNTKEVQKLYTWIIDTFTFWKNIPLSNHWTYYNFHMERLRCIFRYLSGGAEGASVAQWYSNQPCAWNVPIRLEFQVHKRLFLSFIARYTFMVRVTLYTVCIPVRRFLLTRRPWRVLIGPRSSRKTSPLR